ncbi:MAG: hypothetical protein BGO99_11650 [Nitrosospira sp. 56-18]|nr:MAG: hypothetical protein BGO99_11650 [Nitrosospira sp. 56-18]
MAIVDLLAKVFQSFGYFLDRAIESILVKRLAALLCCCAAGTNPVRTAIYRQRRAYWKEYKDHG